MRSKRLNQARHISFIHFSLQVFISFVCFLIHFIMDSIMLLSFFISIIRHYSASSPYCYISSFWMRFVQYSTVKEHSHTKQNLSHYKSTLILKDIYILRIIMFTFNTSQQKTTFTTNRYPNCIKCGFKHFIFVGNLLHF